MVLLDRVNTRISIKAVLLQPSEQFMMQENLARIGKPKNVVVFSLSKTLTDLKISKENSAKLEIFQVSNSFSCKETLSQELIILKGNLAMPS